MEAFCFFWLAFYGDFVTIFPSQPKKTILRQRVLHGPVKPVMTSNRYDTKKQKEVLMPTKKKGKSSAKKTAKRKPAKKAVKKKTPAKKSPPRKKAAAKKKSLKKKTKKMPARRSVKKTDLQTAPVISATQPEVEPGPPPRPLPPLEEPARNETAVGTVTHYYSHLNVVVVQINTGELKTGDTIHIKGHSTDFMQTVESMEYEHRHVDQAPAGQSVGIKVKDHAREHDIVYLVG
jgi:hypothetical protein